jgi:hypothetical protein
MVQCPARGELTLPRKIARAGNMEDAPAPLSMTVAKIHQGGSA